MPKMRIMLEFYDRGTMVKVVKAKVLKWSSVEGEITRQEEDRLNEDDLHVFFFSSRRRHTRCSRDWSSDVCSSDLHSSALPKRTTVQSAVPRQNLEAHLKSTRCKTGCVTCYMCPAGAVMGQDEVFGRHRPNSRLVLPTGRTNRWLAAVGQYGFGQGSTGEYLQVLRGCSCARRHHCERCQPRCFR